MNKLSPKQIAWLIPLFYLLHLSDEYFAGAGFPLWFSGVFNVDLSGIDFIIINSIGFVATVSIVILYNFNKLNSFVIAALGTLFFINGIIHLFASLFTMSYSPGTLTGILIYLPVGLLIFKKILPLVQEEKRMLSIAAGIIIQIVVAVVALNI